MPSTNSNSQSGKNAKHTARQAAQADIFDELIAGHQRQRRLLELLSETQGDSKDRRDLFVRLRTELDAHAEAEERALYSRMMATEDGRERARHSVHEHEQIDDILADLDQMDYSSTGWLNRFATLRDKVEHHLEEEESKVFPLASELFSNQKAREMGERFEEIHADAP